MRRVPRIAIIGGGGLAMALALKRRGAEIVVCEQSPARKSRLLGKRMARQKFPKSKPLTEMAYFDSSFNAKSHSRSGSRSPAFASSMISLASVAKSSDRPDFHRR
jgi:hypothetical protein